jgi:LETM1 and EF-hand domain-containing protein 1
LNEKDDNFSIVSFMQRRKEKKVIEDFLKMIPFSFFLIVPGAELLLPFWLSIFPNSLPS